MLVMPDMDDPFVPLGSEGLFVDPYRSKYVSRRQYQPNKADPVGPL